MAGIEGHGGNAVPFAFGAEEDTEEMERRT